VLHLKSPAATYRRETQTLSAKATKTKIGKKEEEEEEGRN